MLLTLCFLYWVAVNTHKQTQDTPRKQISGLTMLQHVTERLIDGGGGAFDLKQSGSYI